MPRPRAAAGLAVVVATLAAGATMAETGFKSKHFGITCGPAALLGASGIGSDEHRYEFKASCSLDEYGVPADEKQSLALLKDGDGPLHPYGISIKTLAQPILVHGIARWSRQAQTAREDLQLSGIVTGNLHIALSQCPKDPFLHANPLCGTSESTIALKGGKSWEGKLGAALQQLREGVPLLNRQAGLDEALAVSEQEKKSAVPPPPPPKPVVRTPVVAPQSGGGGSAAAGLPALPAAPGVIVLEAEALLAQGRARARGGRLSAQSMSGFGPGWSGGTQLLWTGGAPGSELTLSLDVPAAGHYQVELRWTRAPDFGDVVASLGGGAAGPPLTGYSANVVPAGPASAGSFQMAKGSNDIRLRITGRQAASSGYYFGLDQVRLVPVTR